MYSDLPLPLRQKGQCVLALNQFRWPAFPCGSPGSNLDTNACLRTLQVKALNIPASENFDFSMFLADPKAVRDWNLQGLPSDSFSTENGVMVTRGTRWPLMIDPQASCM